MSEDNNTGLRPTLSVLNNCLASPDDWESIEQYNAVKNGRFREADPLHLLRHPVIQSGRWLTNERSSGDSHKIYVHSVESGLSSVWREIRAGQWRGLFTFMSNEPHWWLLHAGLRRAGDASNVYRKIDTMGRLELEKLLPTEKDLTLFRLERADSRQKQWEIDCALTILEGASAAISTNNPTPAILPAHPAHSGIELRLTFSVERLDDQEIPSQTPADLYLSIETTNWSDSVLRDAILPMLVGLIDPVQEHWEVIEHNGLNMIYLIQTTEVRLKQLEAAGRNTRLAPIVELVSNPPVPKTTFAHYTTKRILADAYTFGIASIALCGYTFVPCQDASMKEICPDCDAKYSSMND